MAESPESPESPSAVLVRVYLPPQATAHPAPPSASNAHERRLHRARKLHKQHQQHQQQQQHEEEEEDDNHVNQKKKKKKKKKKKTAKAIKLKLPSMPRTAKRKVMTNMFGSSDDEDEEEDVMRRAARLRGSDSSSDDDSIEAAREDLVASLLATPSPVPSSPGVPEVQIQEDGKSGSHFVHVPCEEGLTTGQFKGRVLDVLQKKSVLLHLMGSNGVMGSSVFQIVDHRSGRTLLDERPLIEAYFLFEDRPSSLYSSSPSPAIEVTLVEKGEQLSVDGLEKTKSKGKGKSRSMSSNHEDEEEGSSSDADAMVPRSLGLLPAAKPTTRRSRSASLPRRTPKSSRRRRRRRRQRERATQGGEEEEDGEDEENDDDEASTSSSSVSEDEAPVDQMELIVRELEEAGSTELDVPSEDHSVIKINQRGRRQARTLRLSKVGIQNVRSSGKVTYDYKYNDVSCVGLSERDTLMVSFVDGQTLIYNTESAMQIVQEINRRVALAHQSEKRRFTSSLASLASQYHRRRLSQHEEREKKRQQRREEKKRKASKKPPPPPGIPPSKRNSNAKADTPPVAKSTRRRTRKHRRARTAATQSSVSSETAEELLRARDDVLLKVLREGVDGMVGKKVDEEQEEEAPTSLPEGMDPLRYVPVIPESPPESPKPREPEETSEASNAAIEERIQTVVDEILLDEDTDEGSARARFLKNFRHLEKSKPEEMLDTTRSFMDSLKDFIEVHRAKKVVCCLKGGVEEVEEVVKEVVATDEDGEALRFGSAGEEEEEENVEMYDYLEEFGVDVPAIVERSLERAIVAPVLQRVMRFVRRETEEEDALLNRKIALLRGKPQAFFGVKEEQISPSNWTAARWEMSQMEKKGLPGQLLHALLSTAKAIYNTHNFDRNRAEDEARAKQRAQRGEQVVTADEAQHVGVVKNFFLAADEFFPIFVYVTVHADVTRHAMFKRFMWALGEPGALNGELGYYLTSYDAVLSWVARCDVDEEEAQFAQGRKNGGKVQRRKTVL